MGIVTYEEAIGVPAISSAIDHAEQHGLFSKERGGGVNIGSHGWVKRFAETIAYESGVVPEIWNGFVPYDYMPHVVVPFESDGKIRTSCFVLSYPEFEGQMSLPDNDGDTRVFGWRLVTP